MDAQKLEASGPSPGLKIIQNTAQSMDEVEHPIHFQLMLIGRQLCCRCQQVLDFFLLEARCNVEVQHKYYAGYSAHWGCSQMVDK